MPCCADAGLRSTSEWTETRVRPRAVVVIVVKMSMSKPRKRPVSEENRSFSHRWEDEYLCISVNDLPKCLVCSGHSHHIILVNLESVASDPPLSMLGLMEKHIL